MTVKSSPLSFFTSVNTLHHTDLIAFSFCASVQPNGWLLEGRFWVLLFMNYPVLLLGQNAEHILINMCEVSELETHADTQVRDTNIHKLDSGSGFVSQ
jgi:hypothetical protein